MQKQYIIFYPSDVDTLLAEYRKLKGNDHKFLGCPTRYRNRHFFNNFATNEDIATKFETDLPHCLTNVTTS